MTLKATQKIGRKGITTMILETNQEIGKDERDEL